MKSYIFGVMSFFLLSGCSVKHQINIGEITLQKSIDSSASPQEQYMSFTQEYYDNKRYPVTEYCNDKRAYLTDDKFSTETYLKITNERTKQSRVGKYPIWFLLNDDATNIRCINKSANFINEEPFVVSKSDDLSVKLLQKNEAEQGVPIQELGVLINFVSLLVPTTANFLLRTNNLIHDPVTQNYLEMMDNAFKRGDLDGTKSRDFNTEVGSIKVKLVVPEEGKVKQELGYILLKPRYRTTLSTVEVSAGVPNFRDIYNGSDPRISDIMEYTLKNKKISIQTMINNFRQVSVEYTVESLASLNTHLMNRFTRYDRALILSLALRQSNLYKYLTQAVSIKDIKKINSYMAFLLYKENPLHDLKHELKVTSCDYYTVMNQAQTLMKEEKLRSLEKSKKEERLKAEVLRMRMALNNIENFLRPISTENYISMMFERSSKVYTTRGEPMSFQELQQRYNRENNVSAYGCYMDLQKTIHGVSIQDYLIHSNYSHGIKYDYMALSIDKENRVDTIFYKLTSGEMLKIKAMLIDKDSQFITKSKIKELLQTQNVQSCSTNIRSLF